MYPIWEILKWILHGLVQYILFFIPLVKPLQELYPPPGWWFIRWTFSDWYIGLDIERRPNQLFIEQYITAAFAWLKALAVHEANEFTEGVKSFLLGVIGPVFYGFVSMSAWVKSLDWKIGFTLPSWAASLAAGLWRLYHWLPEEVRNWGWTWWRVWDRNIDQAVNIAKGAFAEAARWAWEAVKWVWDVGYQIRTWWLTVSAFVWWLWMDFHGAVNSVLGHPWRWLTDFMNNAKVWVIGWLSPWWEPLSTFARDALWFYYNLWGSYAADLGEFLSNPMDFLWDRGEAYLNRKLG